MQINVEKKTGAFLGIITVLLLVILIMALNKSDGGFLGMTDEQMGSQHSSSSSQYSGADEMFLQMMIPHHQQAIDISILALKTSKDPELLALASTIIKAQGAEIVQMESWLKDAGSSTDMGHSMSNMGGMLDEEELSALTTATGNNFDTLWLKGMIAHHDGAIHMTQMIEDAQNAEIKVFGVNIVKDQSSQIDQMKAMLKRIEVK